MIIWIGLLAGSFLAGVLCGIVSLKNRALLAGAVVPLLGLFASLVYNEYFVPYSGAGASMWPVALIFGGIPAATFGLLGAFATQELRKRRLVNARS